jgi:hypothetical protein
VIDELSEPLFNGESIPSLVRRLSDLPVDLAAFYRLLLERLPREKRPLAQKMLELVLCSHNRISLVTFTGAVNHLNHGISFKNCLNQGSFDILSSCEDMVRQVRSFSGGLLEVVQSQAILDTEYPLWIHEPLNRAQYNFTRQYVQLLHQTAKEFVSDASNSDLMGGNSPKESLVAGHLRLMELYLCIARIRRFR